MSSVPPSLGSSPSLRADRRIAPRSSARQVRLLGLGLALSAAGAFAQSAAPASSAEENAVKLGTFEVLGSKLLNLDLPRSRDGAQPYVVFDRAAVTNSGATSVEEFLKRSLSQNTAGVTTSQSPTYLGSTSTVNLRGLGTGQTLILLDGRRVTPGIAFATSPTQANLNNIPLGAIERIEVLPTTASGIYGGSATGGVVNVILRRDYEGVELQTSYGNTFSGDAAVQRASLTAGFTLEGGKTNVLLGLSASDQNALQVQDRDFIARGRNRVYANNPSYYLNATTPVIGTTANIRSVSGAGLVLKNGTALGSAITYVPTGYAGAASDGGAALAANAGKVNVGLAADGSITGGARGQVLNSPRAESILALVRREFTPNVQAFVDFGASRDIGRFGFSNAAAHTFVLPASAPTNPFAQDVRVTVPTDSLDAEMTNESRNVRAAGGVIVRLPADWKALADYSWSRNTTHWQTTRALLATGTAAVSAGTVDILKDAPIDLRPYLDQREGSEQRITQKDATLRLGGPVFDLPGGPSTLSLLLENLEQDFSDAYQYRNTTTQFYYPAASQKARSAYLEAKLPIVAEASRVPAVERLELQLAGRYDEYRVNGSTGVVRVGTGAPVINALNKSDSFNPTVALLYKPIQDVALRVSYGRGFVPPTPSQLAPSAPFAFTATAVDPRRGNQVLTTGAFDLINGGSPTLTPEKSESWSGGAIFTPRTLPDFRVSLDWTSIKKTNNIARPTIQQMLDNEALFPGRIVRAANLPGDTAGWAGPVTFIDNTAINVSRAEVEAVDLQVDYTFKFTGDRRLNLWLGGTRQLHYKVQLLPSLPLLDYVGISANNPLEYKASAGAVFTLDRHWRLGWNAQYFDSYFVDDPRSAAAATNFANQGGQTVGSQVYHDVFVSYQFGPEAREGLRRWLQNTELQVGVTNVFNKEPPFDAVSTSFFYSPYGDPRLASYTVSLKKRF